MDLPLGEGSAFFEELLNSLFILYDSSYREYLAIEETTHWLSIT
jgi:hypothetical protein